MHGLDPARGPRPLLRLLLALAIVALGAAPVASAAPKAKTSYDYYVTGNPADAASSQPPRSPSTLLMGGGTDVDAAFRWMIDKSGGGDFVVIRATGADGYNQYIYEMGGVDSVESLVIPTLDAANDPFVVERVRKAEALFIAGGDQSDYIEFWKGTALDDAIRDLVRRNVPIGGTSAGLAVLGQFDFAALKGSVTSADALANPYNRRMTLDRDFLTAAAMTGVITDSHLDERDRMGRLLAFLARLTNSGDGWISVEAARGIGVDPSTAVAIDKGVATRLADQDANGADLGGSVYFLRPSVAPTVCEPRQPLTFRNVLVERLSGAGSFHVKNWTGVGGATTRYDLSAEVGVLISSQPGGGIY
jgi:cyanophycinase-like exopeptidase